jgi:hypothetical protein
MTYPRRMITKTAFTPTGPSTYGLAPGIWRLDEVAYWIKQGVWPNPSIIPDQYFPYVSLLLSTTALGNANNNLFVDSSGAFNPVSRNGNTTQGSVTPYSASWSNYFDGTGDYFTVPYTTANFDWYTGGVDFTIECWFFANSLTGTSYVDAGSTKSTLVGNRSATASTDYWSFGPNAGGTVTFYYFNGAGVAVNSTSTITANTWNHIAMTKTSSGITIFVNGVAQTTTAISGTPQSSASFPITIGQGNNTSYNGYVSNLRIVRGTAIYSGNFTVPTAPLTAVTNTTLLTCQSNRFRDASTNNLTLTVTGNTSVTDFSPFAPAYPGISYNQSDITNWSGYFDGSGDFINRNGSGIVNFGTADFTVEAWINLGNTTGSKVILGGAGSNAFGFRYGTSFGVNGGLSIYREGVADLDYASFAFSANTWYHVAVVRQSATIKYFVDGVQQTTQGSGAGSYNYPAETGINVGRGGAGAEEYLGYISNLRVVKGSAVYTSNFTPPTTNLTAISGTSLLTLQNAAFTDNSTNNFVVTINGNTTVTGNSPFNTVGYWSNYFDGSGDYLTAPDNAALQLGSSDFTIEFWVNFTTVPGSLQGATLVSKFNTSNTGYEVILYNNTMYFQAQTANIGMTYAFTPTAGTWYHIAWTRSGANSYGFINGALVASTSAASGSITNLAQALQIGRRGDNTFYLTGYMSNVRVVKGTAVYTAAFTVPTTPLTAITNTSLLTCQASQFIDSSSNAFTITVNGNTSVQSFDPFYTATIASNGGSMYLDGTGDYLRSSIPPLNIRAPFTIEGWVYLSTVTNFVFFSGSTTAGAAGQALYLNELSGLVYFGDGVTNIISFSNSLLPINSWAHIACTFDGTTYRVFINGTSAGSSTSLLTNYTLNSIDVGARLVSVTNYATGYISNFRITRGTALYTATFTPPTAPLTPSANTGLLVNGMNAGAYDATAINNMETVGNAQVSTAVSKFGGSSVYFDGTGDYLTSNAASDLYAFGTGDFTIEMWFNLSSVASLQILYDSRPTSTDGLYPLIYVASGGGSVIWQISAVARITGTATLSTGVWYHIAVSRSSGSTKMFLNGTQIGSTYADTNAYLNSGTTRPFIGGSSYTAGTLTVNGYIDDLRITKGVARYTANFTAPTQAFPTY